jgi:hypothetical protein
LLSGVGTQMFTVSHLRSAEKSVVAKNRFCLTSVRTSAVGTSWMYERPAFNCATRLASMSMPWTSKPACASSTARGRPT